MFIIYFNSFANTLICRGLFDKHTDIVSILQKFSHVKFNSKMSYKVTTALRHRVWTYLSIKHDSKYVWFRTNKGPEICTYMPIHDMFNRNTLHFLHNLVQLDIRGYSIKKFELRVNNSSG